MNFQKNVLNLSRVGLHFEQGDKYDCPLRTVNFLKIAAQRGVPESSSKDESRQVIAPN
jgi:hypothetical protein